MLYKNICISLIFFLFSCSPTETRKRLVVLETGVTITSSIAPFLCRDGHKSFLNDTSWMQDKIGHGTSIVKVITEKLDPKKSCIIVYKTADRGVESNIRAKAYATALVNLASQDFNVLLLALEDVSYFHKEVEWLNTLLARPEVQIVTAAGNSGVELRENKECSVFPACLKPKLLNNERFHIVGSTGDQFNKGTLITARRDSNFDQESGTSFSAARFASELMD